MAGFHSVIGSCRDHSATGKILRLTLEGVDRTIFPATSEEEYDAGTLVSFFPIGRIMHNNVEIGLRRFCIGESFRFLLSHHMADDTEVSQHKRSDRDVFHGCSSRGDVPAEIVRKLETRVNSDELF